MASRITLATSGSRPPKVFIQDAVLSGSMSSQAASQPLFDYWRISCGMLSCTTRFGSQQCASSGETFDKQEIVNLARFPPQVVGAAVPEEREPDRSPWRYVTCQTQTAG